MNATTQRLSNLGLLLVALGAATWGTDTIIRGPLSNTFSPLLLVMGEHLVLALYAIPVVILGWRELRTLNLGQWAALAVVGFGGSAIATVIFTVGIADGYQLLFTPGRQADGASAINTVFLLQQTQPFFAIIAAYIFLRERLTRWYIPIFLVALVGAYLIAFGNKATIDSTGFHVGTLFSPFSTLSDAQARFALIGLGAALLWGTSTSMGRLLSDKLSFQTLTGARFLSGLLILLVLAFATVSNPVGTFTHALGQPYAARNLVLLALFPGLIGLLLYYRGLRNTRASYATLAELIYPGVGVLLNWLVLGAALNPMQGIGVVLVVATILTMNWVKSGVTVAPLPIAQESIAE
jgi:drug/metabolite transporter (DMT)-like permease